MWNSNVYRLLHGVCHRIRRFVDEGVNTAIARCTQVEAAVVAAELGTEDGMPKVLVLDKQDVGISAVEPVGNYAIGLVFDDGHDSGIYSWATLRKLGENHEKNWKAYRERLEKAGMPRINKVR